MLRIATVLSLAAGAMAVLRRPVHGGVSLGEHQANATDLVAEAEDAALCYDSAEISMMADGINQGPKLALVVHRKTGFVLAGLASPCFGGSVHRIMFNDVHNLLPGEKAVHFARDPIDLLVSNFLYDKVSSTERNTLKAGGAGHHMKLCRKNFPDVAKALPQNYIHESLRDYLVRVPEDKAFLLTMCQSKFIMDGMVDTSMWCSNHENCMQVTLSAFMKDSESYMKTWESITSFGHLNMWPKSCLEKQDINSDKWTGRAGHCTTHTMGDDERSRIKAKVTDADVNTFGAYYKNARSKMGL